MTRMTVNGEGVHYKLDPETPLLWALRDASNLTGTKYGCDSRDCGACTVLVDGRAVLSCAVAIKDLEGAAVTTIEGLSADRSHPVQQAWLAEQVTMCGYCEPGFILAIAALLLAPERAFQAVVPVLIALACVLVVVQPRLSDSLARRGRAPRGHGGPLLYAGVLGAGIYGGYFGAAQGVLLIALLGLLLDDDLQRVNAAKNVLAGLVNLVAAVVFIAVTDVAWEAAGLIALGAVVGGQVGAKIGRRVPAPVLRGLVVLVGVVAIVVLVVD